MGNKRDNLPKTIFHECWGCHTVGLKPGILNTKHGDYGMRDLYKKEKELKLNESGLCDSCCKEFKA